jgi:transposase-like protein
MKWRCRLGKAQTRPGLEQAAVSFFNDPIVHWYRNIFSHVPSTKVREIAAMLKAIHAGEDIAAAREKAIRVIEKLRGMRLSRAAELVEMAVDETLSYYAFPEEHWRRIRTTDVFDKPSLTSRRIAAFSLSGLPAAPS